MLKRDELFTAAKEVLKNVTLIKSEEENEKAENG
jgi:hypothetical protein